MPGWNVDLLAVHRARLAALDQMWATPKELAGPEDGDLVLSCVGGEGYVRTTETDLDSFIASFTAARESRLAARVDGPEGLSGLLDGWGKHMSPGRDSQMTLTWPSRDPAMTRVLLGHGFVPQTVLAVRGAGRLLPSGAADVVVREVEPGDVDAAVALWMEALRWDEQFGGTVIRASSEGRVREAVEEVFKPDGPWGWVAERDGQVAGLVVMQPPARAAWVAPAVAVAPASYLTCGIVTAGSRGGGVGGALVRRALEKVDGEGIPVTALHYAALNPLSGPFWHRCGYRPLSMVWARGTVG